MLGRRKTMPQESPQESLSPNDTKQHSISRRTLLRAGIGGAGLAGAAAMSAALEVSGRAFAEEPHSTHGHAHHLMPTVVGEGEHEKNGFNPTEILTEFDKGLVGKLPNGQALHEYTVLAQDTVIEVGDG